ncbi:MAG: M48 family metalloprotease [Pseudomonadota bacterium]
MTDNEPILDTPAPAAARPRVRMSRRTRHIAMVAFIVGAALFLLMLKAIDHRTRSLTDGPAKEAMSPAQLQQFSRDTAKTILTRYRGESSNATQRALIERIGADIVGRGDAKIGTTKYHFHLLAEPDALNLFALPDGGVYITTALVNRMQTEGQLAAAIAHGIAHVMPRDVLSTPVESTTSPNPLLRYTTKEELLADGRALKLMSQAGYDPNAMIGMFTILANAYNAGANVEFFTTHPNTQTRMQIILDSIAAMYPQGVPAILSK